MKRSEVFAKRPAHRSVMPTAWQWRCANLYRSLVVVNPDAVVPRLAVRLKRDQKTVRDLMWRASKNGIL